MLWFEPRIYGVRSNRSTKWATTTAPPTIYYEGFLERCWNLVLFRGDWRQKKQWRGGQDLDGLVCSLSKSTRLITTRSPLHRLRVTLMIYVSGEIIWQHRTETKPTWWICWSRLPDNWSMWPPGFGLVREIFVSSRCRGKFGINSDFRSSFNEITSARKIDAPELTIDIIGALAVT